jgi:hypothetical protein
METFEEHLNSTDWNSWLQEKSRQTIISIADSVLDITVLIPAKASISLRYALWNACKIYVYTIEITTRIDLGELPSFMSDFIFENPEQTETLLEEARNDPSGCNRRMSED